MKRGIHYIVATYTGERANISLNRHLRDPLFLVKMQIESLKNLKIPEIKKVTFVVSPSFEDRDRAIINFVKSISSQFHDKVIEAYIKPTNEYYSYGCWEHCMKNNLEDNLDFFLIEDDYLPARNEFYLPFQEELDKKTAYVCQLYTKVLELFDHAAISNGLMNLDAIKEHVNTFGTCTSIPNMINTTKYNPGVIAQMGFLDHFPKLGYRIKDISAKYKQPYLQANDTIVKYGNRNGEILLQPYTSCLENI